MAQGPAGGARPIRQSGVVVPLTQSLADSVQQDHDASHICFKTPM